MQKRDRTGNMYAMKYVHKGECAMRGALKNVAREVEILSQLEHPCLVNLWFSFQGKPIVYLSIEYREPPSIVNIDFPTTNGTKGIRRTNSIDDLSPLVSACFTLVFLASAFNHEIPLLTRKSRLRGRKYDG